MLFRIFSNICKFALSGMGYLTKAVPFHLHQYFKKIISPGAVGNNPSKTMMKLRNRLGDDVFPLGDFTTKSL